MRLRWSASNGRCLKHLKEPTSKCGAADGAMVHLIEGEWVEVKTLVLGRSATRSAERSAPSSFPPSRAWLLPSALRKQRWWKPIDEDWNGQQRCVPCKIGRSGGKRSSTNNVRMR